jgi:hypothetical protein
MTKPDNYILKCDDLFPQRPARCTRCIHYRLIAGPYPWSPVTGAFCLKTKKEWRGRVDDTL